MKFQNKWLFFFIFLCLFVFRTEIHLHLGIFLLSAEKIDVYYYNGPNLNIEFSKIWSKGTIHMNPQKGALLWILIPWIQISSKDEYFSKYFLTLYGQCFKFSLYQEHLIIKQVGRVGSNILPISSTFVEVCYKALANLLNVTILTPALLKIWVSPLQRTWETPLPSHSSF